MASQGAPSGVASGPAEHYHRSSIAICDGHGDPARVRHARPAPGVTEEGVPFDVRRMVRDLRPGSVGMSFELRLYRLLCLATSALLLGVVIPINFFQNTSPWLDVVCSISGILALVLYLLAVHGVLFKRSYLLLIALLLNIAWFAEGGAEGSIGYFFYVAVVYAVIFFSGVERWMYLVLCALDGLALLAVDFVRPAWSVPFDSRLDRLIDLTTGLVLGVVGLTMMIWLVRS